MISDVARLSLSFKYNLERKNLALQMMCGRVALDKCLKDLQSQGCGSESIILNLMLIIVVDVRTLYMYETDLLLPALAIANSGC